MCHPYLRLCRTRWRPGGPTVLIYMVHQASKVDQTFTRNIQNLDPILAVIPDGEMLPINGELVVKWITPLMPCAIELFRFVDNWMTTFKN